MDWTSWPGRDPKKPGGYLYLLALSSGVVKIGATRDPRGRVQLEQERAALYGVTISDAWLSPRHSGHIDSERTLLARLPVLGPCSASTTVTAPLTKVVAAAEELPFQPAQGDGGPTRVALLRAQRHHEIRELYDRKQSVREVAKALGVSKSLVANVVRPD